jgi:hypothetical protein
MWKRRSSAVFCGGMEEERASDGEGLVVVLGKKGSRLAGDGSGYLSEREAKWQAQRTSRAA